MGFLLFHSRTVDNFAVVGRIPADETIVYKKNNPALVFEFSEMIEDYNLLGSAQIKLPMQLIPAQGMTCVAVKADEIDLEPYKAMLKAPADGRRAPDGNGRDPLRW